MTQHESKLKNTILPHSKPLNDFFYQDTLPRMPLTVCVLALLAAPPLLSGGAFNLTSKNVSQALKSSGKLGLFLGFSATHSTSHPPPTAPAIRLHGCPSHRRRGRLSGCQARHRLETRREAGGGTVEQRGGVTPGATTPSGRHPSRLRPLDQGGSVVGAVALDLPVC